MLLKNKIILRYLVIFIDKTNFSHYFRVESKTNLKSQEEDHKNIEKPGTVIY